MNITLEGSSKAYVEHLVQTGQYDSPRDVVNDVLRCFQQEEERRTAALRAKIDAALAEDGEVTEEELDAFLAATMEKLKREGY